MEAVGQESEYFTSQVHREVKRVCSIDYELARMSCMNLADMMKRFIHQVKAIAQYY